MTRRRKIAAVVAACVIAGLLSCGAAAEFAHTRYIAAGPLPQPRNVVVPRGTPGQVAAALLQAGVIDDARAFWVAALVTGGQGPLHAAELAFPPAASLRTVLRVLRTGKPVEHLLVIPEGLTAAQISMLLAHAEAMTGAAPVPGEGAVLPQSYAYEYGADRSAVLGRAEAAMHRALARAWNQREADLPLKSPAELLTLASIVERETARPEERPHVASVLLNRIRQGMKLQSDPTVAYAASGGRVTADPELTRSDLDLANPYNTYHAAGLPPGPIDSPGIASLAAAAHPVASGDLFFVADGNGGHAFARTLEEHNRNVARWRKREQGGP